VDASTPRRPFYSSLYVQVLIAIAIGTKLMVSGTFVAVTHLMACGR